MDDLEKIVRTHWLPILIICIITFPLVLSQLRRLFRHAVLSPVRQALLNLPLAEESTLAKMTSTHPSPDERLCLRLGLADALVVIHHFFYDPRYWFTQTGAFSLSPHQVPYENSWDVYGTVLVVRHRTRVGPAIDIELLQFARVEPSKFLIRIEADSHDWYVDAYRRYSDLRQAIAGVLGQRKFDVL